MSSLCLRILYFALLKLLISNALPNNFIGSKKSLQVKETIESPKSVKEVKETPNTPKSKGKGVQSSIPDATEFDKDPIFGIRNCETFVKMDESVKKHKPSNYSDAQRGTLFDYD
jgi:hypothetical protein